jgi:hypothetical protein
MYNANKQAKTPKMRSKVQEKLKTRLQNKQNLKYFRIEVKKHRSFTDAGH